jgi:type IV pilus assembly protein PilX
MKGIGNHRSERGIALVMALLVLLVLSIVGLVLISGATLDRGVAGNDQRSRQALNIAESGVGEAIARIRNLETGMSESNPNAVCQVFNTYAGSVPALGTDSLGLATAQPAGTFQEYTTASRSPDVLTIRWKKNAAGTKVMRYDSSRNPAINDQAGLPIYVVESTGRIGSARRTVVSEVIQKPFVANCRAALAAAVPIDFAGNAYTCGYNHAYSTPYDDGKNGRNSGPGGGPYDCIDNEVSNPLPGAWSTGSISGVGISAVSGSPVNTSQNQTGFYAGPWEAFGVSQSEWWSWIGSPTMTPSSYNGILNIDNNTTTQDQSATYALHSVDGEGLLYVDGSLRLNAGFHWRGLVYVEGDFDINGQAWVLGGVIVRGQTLIRANGGMTILYSSEAITQSLAKYGGQFVTLSWREK